MEMFVIFLKFNILYIRKNWPGPRLDPQQEKGAAAAIAFS